MKKEKRSFRIVKAELPDDVLWKEFWKNKTPEDKLNAGELIIRGGRATQRLQRIFRTAKRA